MRHFARRQACAAARTADTTEEGIMDTEASSDRPVDQSTVQKRGAATGLSTSGGTEHKSRRCSTVCGTKNPQARKSRRQSIISQEIELLTKLGENQAAISEGRDGLMDQYEPRGCSPGKKSHGPLMPSQASQKLAESNKLEDQINLQHLVELMRIFHEADENGSDGLDIDEFRTAFGQILGKGKNDQQMAIMFMKIDTNCDGTVDWDEFCTYMLLEYQEKDTMAGEKLQPFPYPLRVLHCSHREVISKIVFLPTLNRRSHDTSTLTSERQDVEGRYISVCKDGTICFWKNDFTLQKMITVECKPKLTWVTDMVVMPNINKFILASTDNTITVYDLTTATFDGQFHIVAFPHCVLVMDYWFDPKDFNRAVLVLGDSGGGVCIMEFHYATSSLFGVSTSKQVNNMRIPFPELQYHRVEGMKVVYMPKVHGDWVCKVKYCPCMEYIMSCSGDSTSSLYLGDLHGRKEGSMFRVRKGVAAFDYCKEWNIIATGGLDRFVRFWNPYITGKPIAVLKGHSTTILHVAINSTDGQVLSFSKDMELRVWNIQDQLCLQRCHRFQQLAPQLPTAFFLHPHTGIILIGTNQLGVLEPYRDDDQYSSRGEVVSHEKPLCVALYNQNFNQVVSGCHGSVVSVWDVDTGEKTIQFSQCHGNVEITAMTFDTTGRRLVTGARDGSIKIWNFNNGACLCVLETQQNAEVTSINVLKQRVVVGGWSRQLVLFRDTREDLPPKYWGGGIHHDDILCMAYQEPNVMASGSYDGDIVLWNVDVERSLHRLNANNENCQRQHRFYDAMGSKTYETKQSSTEGDSRPARGKDERAIEKVTFLETRGQDHDSATLVACGAGGWVQFWNIHGGGLVGEFNVWDDGREASDEDRRLGSVTALTVDCTDSVMFTGNSMGYLQSWDISDYCLCVSSKPVTRPPSLQLDWRGHLSSVVSIALAEDKKLLITASTDCCVRLWTMNGRYIGTFGEKAHWKLSYPIKPTELPRKTPPGINRVASFKTMQIVSGPSTSKWKLAKNLFRVLRQTRRIRKALQGGKSNDQAQSLGNNTSASNVLGKCYQRKTRFRQPVVPSKLRQTDGKPCGIYTALRCSDIQEPDGCKLLPPISGKARLTGSGSDKVSRLSSGGSSLTLPRLEHTEASLLPTVNRRVTITQTSV